MAGDACDRSCGLAGRLQLGAKAQSRVLGFSSWKFSLDLLGLVRCRLRIDFASSLLSRDEYSGSEKERSLVNGRNRVWNRRLGSHLKLPGRLRTATLARRLLRLLATQIYTASRKLDQGAERCESELVYWQ
jgi:hypothetical protein